MRTVEAQRSGAAPVPDIAFVLRPRWDEGGRVIALDIVPASELQRPRIDVVVQVTGAYRDQFETFMRLLAAATEQLSKLEEPGKDLRPLFDAILSHIPAPAVAGGAA